MSERPRRSSSLAQAEQRHAVKAKNEAWSEIEKKWFREAYAKFGSAWGPVSEYIGTRNYAAVSLSQIIGLAVLRIMFNLLVCCCCCVLVFSARLTTGG